MKILILSNFVLPAISKELGISITNGGGWIVSLVEVLSQENQIVVGCYSPTIKKTEGFYDEKKYYIFSQSNIIGEIKRIIDIEKPDIIHSFGTEHKQSYDMICACEQAGVINRTVTNIQGLSSEIEKFYFEGLPITSVLFFSIRDLLKFDNVFFKRLRFKLNGIYEKKMLLKAKNIIGRTDWDYACTNRINPTINYFHCNETLRKIFYAKEWNYDECEKYSIFVSQCNYPIKGFHFMLDALKEIKKSYLNVKLYVAGDIPKGGKKLIKSTYYVQALRRKIKSLSLDDNVVFLGDMSAEKMCESFINANVFVSCSSIENSSNAIAEAMILGMPIVASNVGGTSSMIVDKKEGYLYPLKSTQLLELYIKKIFTEKDVAIEMGKNARKRAIKEHNYDHCMDSLMTIYKSVLENIDKEVK